MSKHKEFQRNLEAEELEQRVAPVLVEYTEESPRWSMPMEREVFVFESDDGFFGRIRPRTR